MACPTDTSPAEYAKRPGTSGIRGHLYETKLLSLIYFRAIHDDDIEEFHLATNMDNMGSFDDICFRVKWKEVDKPLVVFIQVKHKENNQHLSLQTKADLVKYFKSYLEIKRKFHPNNKDLLFEGTFSETECLFVIYTTAKLDNNTLTYEYKEYEQTNKLLNELIGTAIEADNQHDLQLPRSLCPHDQYYNNFDLTKLVLEEHITALARQMAKGIFGEIKDSQMLMQNEYVIRYHVILAQKVFDVSEDQTEGQRIARFRQDFFYIDEEFLRLFKDELCTEILKRRKCVNRKDYNVFSSLREVTDVEELYDKVRSFITYRNGKFVWLDKMTPDSVCVLDKINESQVTIRRTVEVAVKECLPSLQFKVPASFGNKDLLIRGDEDKVERKLNDLTSKLVRLIENPNIGNLDNRVFIDKSMGEGFLQHNGGIASAVGNLFISSIDGHLKFNPRYESLGPLAKRLFDKLKSKLKFIFDYTFKVAVDLFPKLSFDLVNESYGTTTYVPDLESEFLNKLLLYTSQRTEQEVEETLIHEINDSQSDDAKIYSDAIFLRYHDAVQKWWMTSGVAPYLSREGIIYQQAVKHASSQSLTSIMNMIYKSKNKNFTLSEDATNSIKLDDQPSGTIIVSDNSALTVAKFSKNLNRECIVLDLKYIRKLSAKDGQTLRTELTDTNEIKTVIVIFNKSLIGTRSSKKTIVSIANAIQSKNVIIITDQNSVEITREYFSRINKEIKDERCKLIDMRDELLKNILENTKVIFHNNEIDLDQALDDESINYVGGRVLHKLMHSNRNIIGKPVSNSKYISELYIQRTVVDLSGVTLRLPGNVRRVEGVDKRPSTLYDIAENIVLIVGDPGMGKSTLLTHLSLKTKELNPTVWILRINLLENTRQYSEWQEHKTDIDILESLKFLCQVALSEERSEQDDVQITLEESNGTVHLKNCTGDEWTVFELKLFLHYFNTKNIIILFDGFDEICPTYAQEVLTLIRAVENFPRKHKMWITSRSYDKIITILELRFRTLYRIKPLKENEQYDYLQTFWENTRILENVLKYLENSDLHLYRKEIENIFDFSMFMSKHVDLKFLKKKCLYVQSKTEIHFLVVYVSLFNYLLLLFDPEDHFFYIVHRNISRIKRSRPNNEEVEECEVLMWRTGNALRKVCDKIVSLHFNEFVATPLLLNMTAEYLYNQMTTNKRKPYKGDTNNFDIYESFLETKLKRIRFQEKNKNDMSKPDNISHYKKVYADTLDKHKKLGAYAVYGGCLLDDDELKQCKDMINELKEGEERTGIICNVVNDIPIFVHSTFAEYFAVEHICDILKSKRNPRLVWDFILNVMFFKNINALVLLDAKMEGDAELSILVGENKQMIFELLLEQSENTKYKFGDIKSSLCEAIRHDLRRLASLLLSTIEDNLIERNVIDFIKIVKQTNMLIVAVKMEFEEVVVTIVDSLRVIDESKLSDLFANIESLELTPNFNVVSTDELVQKLHCHVWMRMDIVPEWKNLAEWSGQIYFI